MLLAASVVFLYYTTWAILLVCGFIALLFTPLTSCLDSHFSIHPVLCIHFSLHASGQSAFQLLFWLSYCPSLGCSLARQSSKKVRKRQRKRSCGQHEHCLEGPLKATIVALGRPLGAMLHKCLFSRILGSTDINDIYEAPRISLRYLSWVGFPISRFRASSACNFSAATMSFPAWLTSASNGVSGKGSFRV
jgi:hypothetical protein